MRAKEKKSKRVGIRVRAAAVLVTAGCLASCGQSSGGYRDYTVQKEQYYAECSAAYDYKDVVTVEYPVLQGLKAVQAKDINKLLYDVAMEKVNYWHLAPDEDVRKLQEIYEIYSSDVHCEVPYHSQYLMSVHYQETYAPISPACYIHKTQRSANINLMTGKAYTLSDIFRIDNDFIEFWCGQVASEGTYGDLIVDDADTRDAFLSWFLDQDEETAKYYLFTPFFYLDENKDFVIGLSYDPKPNKVTEELPMNNSFIGHFESEDLAPYRTESEFWDWYERSDSAGKVLECADLQDNLWLEKHAGVCITDCSTALNDSST